MQGADVTLKHPASQHDGAARRGLWLQEFSFRLYPLFPVFFFTIYAVFRFLSLHFLRFFPSSVPFSVSPHPSRFTPLSVPFAHFFRLSMPFFSDSFRYREPITLNLMAYACL